MVTLKYGMSVTSDLTGAAWIGMMKGRGLSEESRDQHGRWQQFFTFKFSCVLRVCVLTFKIGPLGVFYNAFYNNNNNNNTLYTTLL